jgi:hypothetical protein
VLSTVLAIAQVERLQALLDRAERELAELKAQTDAARVEVSI